MKYVEIHWTLHPEKSEGLYYDSDGKPRSPWYDSEIKKKNMTPAAVARELDLNDELSVEGVVFPEFRPSHIYHGEQIINPEKTVYRILDYGGCCAALFCQKDDYGGVNIFKEIVILKNGDANKLGQAVRTYSAEVKCQGFVDHDDPAGKHDKHVSGTCSAQIITNYGIHPTHTHSEASSQRKKDRIEFLHHKLMERVGPEGREAFQVHESCTTLIDAFQNGYRFLEKPNGEIDQDVIDEQHPYEDVMDCAGMFLMEQFTVTNSVPYIPSRRRGPVNPYTGRRS